MDVNVIDVMSWFGLRAQLVLGRCKSKFALGAQVRGRLGVLAKAGMR